MTSFRMKRKPVPPKPKIEHKSINVGSFFTLDKTVEFFHSKKNSSQRSEDKRYPQWILFGVELFMA